MKYTRKAGWTRANLSIHLKVKKGKEKEGKGLKKQKDK